MKYILYYLINPLNQNIFYVGITSNPKRRAYEHSKTTKREWSRNVDKTKIVYELKKQNIKPELRIIIDNLSKSEAEEIEIETILAFRISGFPLTNISDGGNINIASEETRKKISMKAKGRTSYIRTDAHKEIMSIAQKGHKVSEETKEKIKQANTGRSVTEATREKMSIIRKANKKPKTIKQLESLRLRNSLNKGKAYSKERLENVGKGKYEGYKIINKEEVILTIPKNLYRFCKENNLDSGHLAKVLSGIKESHKGFRLYI